MPSAFQRKRPRTGTSRRSKDFLRQIDVETRYFGEARGSPQSVERALRHYARAARSNNDGVVTDANEKTVEDLDRDECLRLLRSEVVGRIAVVVDDDSPLVVPVNYSLDDDVVVFRTAPGSKLWGLRRRPVSFEVDQHDWYTRTGWSVLVRGTCHEVDEDAAGAVVQPWDAGDKRHWVRLVPHEITGRRITLPVADVDSRGYI